jgi:hypothetical protein
MLDSTSRRDACQLAQMKAPEGAESWTAVRIGVTAPRSKIFIGSCRGRELLTNQI